MLRLFGASYSCLKQHQLLARCGRDPQLAKHLRGIP